MKRYNPSEIEPKWQQIWDETKAYQAQDFSDKPKMYISCMFPYPSGAGMHTGHAFEHSIVDSVARFYRQHGYNVLNPMGWDAFGLPAENYAIKNNVSPAEVTKANIANFITQLKRMGTGIDWSREINTSDPEYYRWTQWIFAEFFKRGLAYQKESLQWWCPVDKTVLANEQVVNGRCWRCGSEVVKKSMNQWFLKITDYADSLLNEIEDLDWPQKIKAAQTNWIGRSQGAEISFAVDGIDEEITVFTTRPDTLSGATFVVLAPENSLVSKIVNSETKEKVEDYVATSVKKSEIERMSEGKEKTGVFTGAHAINPITGKKMPIWVADYVLAGYGTGAVMAVPAHDQRDFAFAEKFDLPIIQVVEPAEDDIDYDQCYSGEGVLINSGQFDGMTTSEAREEIVAWLEEAGVGKPKVTYKMRDWLISRQRYWGAPIPIIHCPEHGAVPVPEDQLPVLLPHVEDYAPKGDGKSVLAAEDDWVNTPCPICGGAAKRETDTMDGFACSSWYLLRFTDPHNNQAAWDPKKANYWAPLDFYVGGDHAVAHLLYVRFWTHVFKDMGLLNFNEPLKKLVYHGLIQAEDGRKMSKSLGNVIDPLDVIDQGYGADALRVFLLFLGPIDVDANWSSNGIAGVYRFLNRIWTIVSEYLENEGISSAHQGQADSKPANNDSEAILSSMHKTIKKVTEDYHRLSFNTAVAALMEYTNELYKYKTSGFNSPEWKPALESLVVLLSPMAPHMTAELWQMLGHSEPIEDGGWPKYDPSKTKSNSLTVVVQVNGKLRAKLNIDAELSEDEIKNLALNEPNVQKSMDGKQPTKVIYVPKKLVSIVVK